MMTELIIALLAHMPENRIVQGGLLTPVPEPATAVLMLLGLGVIAVMMRCRSSRMV